MREMEKVNWVRGACIGRGSFGTVNLAVGKSNGHIFAVKSVDQSFCSASQLEALENEIQILRSLSSPYVVEYVGDDKTASFRNMHMEYMPGGTVTDVTKFSGGGVDEKLVKSYTWCLVSALSYVHAKGVVHCDVKGKNVLVGSTPGVAKLADFGSAMESTAEVLPRGSPLWMSPEVVRREYQGPESDVWSVGCTVIEMVTGKPAWEDRGADTLCRIGYSDESPELPTRLSELGRDFIDKCLRRELSERWSCDQLLRHPFISSSSPPSDLITHPSPRCVLDCFDSESSDEDSEEITENLNCKLRIHENSRERIGKLATSGGVNWESDGWVVVRKVSDACCSGVQERTNSVYPELDNTEEEISRTSLEYFNFRGVELETDLYPLSNPSGATHTNSSNQLGIQPIHLYKNQHIPNVFSSSVILLFYAVVILCILMLLYSTLFRFYLRLQTLHVAINACL